MQELTLKKITKTFNKVKRLAQKAYDLGNYELCLHHIETAADIAYNFNWIYTDSDLEELLANISTEIIEQRDYSPIKDRIVFYDAFAIDNKGLTQQYLKAMISWGIELLFIVEKENLSRSKNIIKELLNYDNAELFIVDSKLSAIKNTQEIYNKIVDFQPEKAFLHLQPSSAMAVTLWNALSLTTRYQINLSDHVFWLGTSCIDYCIEFRNYGWTVSQERRYLLKEQLLVQPYYPIGDCDPFQGFPNQVRDDNVVILTGGAFYKMYGENNMFFTIMKQLLDINSKVIILIAGGGDAKPLNEFISKHSFQKRILLIGNRSDINYIFENCDIYLSTFPISGGLMGQFAAVNAKPILSYSPQDLRLNFIEGLMNWGNSNNCKITHTTVKSMVQYAEKLITDQKYRIAEGNILKEHIIKSHEFSSHLRKLINSNTNLIKVAKEEIDYDKLTTSYLVRENNFLQNFYTLIISRFKFSTFVFFPKIGLRSLFSKKIFDRVLSKLQIFKHRNIRI